MEYKMCEKCGASIPPKEEFCPNCGIHRSFDPVVEENKRSKMTKCEYCGAEIHEETVICPNCKKNRLYNNNSSQPHSKCPHCGTDLQSNAKFCPQCGYNLHENKEEVAGFVLGMISLIAWLLPLVGFPVSIIGVIISANGVSNRKRYADAGVALNILGFIATLINSIAGAVISSR